MSQPSILEAFEYNVKESDVYWFANQNVGVNLISTAISEYSDILQQRNKIPAGHYTNTSLSKLVVNRLCSAGCPELLVASAIGHYVSQGGSNSAGFTHRNSVNHITGMNINDELTHKKLLC